MTSRGTKYWNSGAIPLIAPEILGDIISEVADVGVVIGEAGEVLSVLVNPNNDAFRKFEKVEGEDFRSTLTIESVPKFEERLAVFLNGEKTIRPVELNHAGPFMRWEFPVRYSLHRIGPDGAILLLGRDLRPVAEMQQQLVKAQLAMERDFEEQREFETRFRVLMESTTDAVVYVSMQSGQITEANAAASALLDQPRDTLIGRAFSDCCGDAQRGDIIDRLSGQALSERGGTIKAEIRKTGAPIALASTIFRAAGERMLLCRIVPKDESAQPADVLSENLRQLYHSGPDAIAFTTQDGKILSINESFLDLIGVADDANLRQHSIADFMQRGSVDVKVMTENAGRAGRMRHYATKVAGEYGSPRDAEISVTAIQAGAATIFAFVVREAGRGDAGRRDQDQRDDSMESVVELVGSATLKDIVAETTNVVEKMCIETAVELTMNNRVAAAEMLGLSRQSLYVKLRKFGLLARDPDR